MAGASHPRVITFGTDDGTVPDGGVVDAETLGAKGAGLVDMASAGLPVPPGFVLPTSLCRTFATDGWTPDHDAALAEGIERLEAATGRRLGDPDRPLLVSVRSGAPVSMPGMLDSVLDVGMTDEIEKALGESTGDAFFAIDTHRRFLDSYESVAGGQAPQDPAQQLKGAAAAVFASHDGPRARAFQHRQGVEGVQPTAVVVQQMVFGNRGDDSGTGVAHSHDPVTNEHRLTGEFLYRAQGVDVVSGTHQTRPLEGMRLRVEDAYIDLGAAVGALESRHGSAVEVEFTVERGRLFLLQVRGTVPSTESVQDQGGPLGNGEAAVPGDSLATGIPASPGRATGFLCTEIDDALDRHDAGESIVLVRPETSPADVEALAVASGLVTTRGGMTSHAAVVARAWGIPAVVGAAAIEWGPDGITVGSTTFPVGSVITIDGTSGRVDVVGS